MLKRIDKDIGYMMEELEERGMDDINVMIVSDHGFADVKGEVYLNECPGLDTELFNVTENNPVVFIWPYKKGERILLFPFTAPQKKGRQRLA